MFIHKEEEGTVGAILRHANANPGDLYQIEYADGATYVCSLDTAYDTDNVGDGADDDEDPRYDEFHQIVFKVINTARPGPQEYNGYLAIDYRQFPAAVTDLTSGKRVYPDSAS